METVTQHYMDQAINGGNSFSPGSYPVQRFYVSKGELPGLIARLKDVALQLDGDGQLSTSAPYVISEHGTHPLGKVQKVGHVLEFDSSLAASGPRAAVMEGIFWQRVWQCVLLASGQRA